MPKTGTNGVVPLETVVLKTRIRQRNGAILKTSNGRSPFRVADPVHRSFLVTKFSLLVPSQRQKVPPTQRPKLKLKANNRKPIGGKEVEADVVVEAAGGEEARQFRLLKWTSNFSASIDPMAKYSGRKRPSQARHIKERIQPTDLLRLLHALTVNMFMPLLDHKESIVIQWMGI
jgi:hypothetical protein